jgi:hypothetical protein
LYHLEKRVIEGETIELAGSEVQYLGHDLTLIGCRLVIRVSASALTITHTRLIDCDIEVKKKLTNFPWFTAYLEDCRFTGTLSGCDFGHSPEHVGDTGFKEGGIRGCDFRGATLDRCRIVGSDQRTLHFPKWPCFTILEPMRRQRELAAVEWPGRMAPALRFEGHPPRTTAGTFSSEVLIQKYGGTAEEVKRVLATLPDVVY